MITEDLIAYIQAQLRKNISKGIIVSRLVDAGWHVDDVEEAFIKIFPPVSPTEKKQPVATNTASPIADIPNINKTVTKDDQYRESLDQETDKVWSPMKIESKLEQPQPQQQASINSTTKPVFSSSFSEAHAPSTTTTPINLAPKISNVLEVRNEELIPTLRPKVTTTPTQELPNIPKVEPVTINSRKEEVFQTQVKEPVVMPTSVSADTAKPSTNSTPISLAGLKMTSGNIESDVPESSNIPSGAMLHSYKKALFSASAVQQQLSQTKKHTITKLIIIILIISAIGGSVFAITEGYLKMPSFLNFSFIKKDPKSILINAPIDLSELSSYKIETNASISVPPLANITSGLVSGEAVPSHDKDSITMVAEGYVNNENQETPIFDYEAAFSSSLFTNNLLVDLKYNNLVSLVTTPNLSELLGTNAPEVKTVLVPKGQFGSFIALLPNNIQSKVEKINIDKLFAVGVPSYINKETSSIFKDFVNSATVIEKSPQDIRGVTSYHYQLNADRQASKRFINEFINVFTTDLSKEDKEVLSDRLGAVSIDSLEVWIGQEDNKIHQFAFSVKTPLSRLIGLDDKGIAGNEVSLDWKTTYFDFDIHNNITTPDKVIEVSDYLKDINDMKIKNKISSFKPIASNFKNAVGNYGKRGNPTGSCTNPNPSSLFSPIGHPKGASTAVGNIASLMNDILGVTGGALSCYSSSNAWALSAPLATDPTKSFCTDSTGASSLIDAPITGPACK